MKVPEIPFIENLSESIADEEKILEERLALLRSSDVRRKLAEFEELKKRLEVLHQELLVLRDGSLIQNARSKPTVVRENIPSKGDARKRENRPAVSQEEAYHRIVEAVRNAPDLKLTRSELCKNTGLGKPKINEGIAFKPSRFETTRGPLASVKLVAEQP